MILHNISGVHDLNVIKDSHLYIFLHDMQSLELDVRIRITKPGVHASLTIVHLQKQQETLKLATLQQHDAPHTSSTILVKGVVYDHARFDYAGKIYVGPKAHQTQAEQKSHTLLLSSTAQAQAVPALEVLTNDVQCKHGSAIAGLDTTLIEYLACRGIQQADAQNILVKSFFLSALENPLARDYFLSNVI